MMKSRFQIKPILLGIAGALVITMGSCSEDFFNKQAGDRITPDQHWQDIIDGNASWQGAIINLQDAMPRLIMLDGLRSDQMDVTMNADQYFREINEHIYSDFNPYLDLADLNKVIVNLNEVLAYLDELAANERELDDHTTFFAKGEFLAMRAWVYFQSAKLYGKVTYLPDNLETLPEELDGFPIIDKADIIDTLINQIEPYIYDPLEETKIEIKVDHYVNPKAILGELYLEKGDYANAAKYLKMACESFLNNTSLYKVDNTYSENAWFTMFLNAEYGTLEHFSVIPFSATDHQLNPLATWMGYRYDYLVKPSQVLVDSFEAQVSTLGNPGDYFRGNGFIETGITYGVDTLSKSSEEDFDVAYYISKYEMDPSDPYSTDIILQRAADMHLLLAEAYNRLGDEDSQYYALMLLNEGVNAELPKPPGFTKWAKNMGIRGRVKLEPWVLDEGITGEERTLLIEDLIMRERGLEMAFEGKRWTDLMRVAERRGDPSYLADQVAAKFEDAGTREQVRSTLMNPKNWYLPVR